LHVVSCETIPSDNENIIFDKLKELRRKIASEEGVPPYVVFSNASLWDMCRKRPTSLIQFSTENGVGAIKLKKYGETFIKVIKAFL
jgi:ATP-dependent DNA helicase RecQ